MKTAIVILSDPKTGGEEALGRLFNGLAAAYDFQSRGDAVTVLFQGAATRWVGHLSEPEHPAHDLFKAVEGSVAGVSCGCADVFGGGEEAERAGLDLVRDNPVPGTSGLPSLSKLAGDGYSILTF